MKKGLVAFGAILIVTGTIFFVLTNKGTAPAPANGVQSPDNSPSLQPTDTTTNTDTAPAVVITYTNDGFSPKSVTAKVGDVIEVNNQSSQSLQFSSDSHPAHIKNTELNQSTISAGGSQTFTVTKKGTFGFHNHLDSRQSGTLTVE